MILLSVAIIAVSYLLGSMPFGYIFSKISGKNILEIGWRKTSGSNVFKNVGLWQGLATGIFDIGKGYLAVSLAQNFGLPSYAQALSGVAAVAGHNWSLFLKFAGGRGIGTFIGAFLALSFPLTLFSVIPLILLALIWNASIGTIFFLVTSFLLSIYFNQFQTVGIFTLVSLIPIFVKRLSPIEEIKKSENKNTLIRNRLVFDDDIARFDLRIAKIIEKLTKR